MRLHVVAESENVSDTFAPLGKKSRSLHYKSHSFTSCFNDERILIQSLCSSIDELLKNVFTLK
jgi:hypothetical protein